MHNYLHVNSLKVDIPDKWTWIYGDAFVTVSYDNEEGKQITVQCLHLLRLSFVIKIFVTKVCIAGADPDRKRNG